jgi:hypothetical protein
MESSIVSETLSRINIGLRGIIEMGIVLAIGYWGFHAVEANIARILLGIGAPLAVFGFWGLVDFHEAGRRAESLRLIQELVVTGLAAVRLFVAGQPALAWAMGLLSVVHHALVYSLGERLLKQRS